MSVEVEQTAYGVADTITVTTPLSTQPQDLGALSQKVNPTPFSVYFAFILPNNKIEPHLVLDGLLDELENDYETDIITLKGRGILANLVDARISVKPNMNSTITNVITQLIKQYTQLTPKIQSTSVLAGTIIKDDYIAMSRNLKALDFIQLLARSQGWTVRVSNGVIVVGDPPDPSEDARFSLNFAGGDWLSLKITHNALHNKNIKVKVVSYGQSTKHRGLARSQGAVAALLGLPVPVSKTASPAGTKAGPIDGTTSVGERDNVEEYVIPIHNLDQQACLDLAAKTQAFINLHEFVAQGVFTLGADDLRKIAKVSPDFIVDLAGCDQPSNNGTYFPHHVNWDWDVSSSSGLTFDVELVNHVLPVPTGGTANEPSVGAAESSD
jgi:hypothetical protein